MGLNELNLEHVRNKLELCSNFSQIFLEFEKNTTVNRLSKLLVKMIGLSEVITDNLTRVHNTVLNNTYNYNNIHKADYDPN